MKIGKFSMSHCLLNRKDDINVDLYAVFGKVIVTRAESNYMNQTINYEAISELFRDIKEGELIPWYNFYMDSDKNITAKEITDTDGLISSYRWSSF